MERVLVRYKVKPGSVEENEKLVKEVYKQLQELKPENFRYATYKLDDGLTFIHLALYEGPNPLAGLQAFKDFQADIKNRCDEMPAANHPLEIGSYMMNGE